jgi:HEAT repeat protein
VNDFLPDIWQMQMRADVHGLSAALRHVDPLIRRRAAAALRALGSVNAADALRAQLDIERDPDTRTALVAALAALEGDSEPLLDESDTLPMDAHMPGLSDVDQWLEWVQTGTPAQIAEAAAHLADAQERRAVEPLVVAFNNAALPGHVRLSVAEALLRMDSAPVEVSLLGALRSDRWRVRRNAAAILGQLAASWAVKPLAALLTGDDNEVVRKTAHAALRRIDTADARAALNMPAAGPSAPDEPSAPEAPPAPDLVESDSTSDSRRFQWPRRTSESERQMLDTTELNPVKLQEARDRLERQKRRPED